MIAILGAMQAEVDSLLHEIKDLKLEKAGGFDFARGEIRGCEVVVARCGVGKVNAAACTQALLTAYEPEVVVNTGVAGSLSPELDILDVAVATDAVQHDYDTTGLGEPVGALSIHGALVTYLPCDAGWREKLLDAAKQVGAKAIPARVASGDRFVTHREDKRRIVETFGAAVCEMEGAAIAQVCYLHNTPCAILRVISDSTDEDHHMEFTTFVGRAVETSFNILTQFLSQLKIIG